MLSSKERLFEIVGVIKKYDLLKNATPTNLRLAIEELGPTFIKLGQILSSRDDVIPKAYCEELTHLRNQVKPMPYEEVIDILDHEYNGKTDEIFAHINKTPIGSASIAQVHKAVLKDKTEVVIKVQRANIYELMSMDVKLLKRIIELLHVDKIFNSVFNFSDVIDEMFETAKEEMNFLIEASHTEEFREKNKNVVYIGSPRVYKEYTTSKALVMEYMDGFKINDFESLKKNGYDIDEIAEKLAANYIKQAIDDGYFHADPHADNLKIKDGKIIYLDFGMMGKLTKIDRELLSKCILAILKDDYTEVSHILLTLGKASGPVDQMALRNDIKLVLERNKSQDFSDIDIKVFINDLLSMLSNNNISLPRDITMLIRGILVIEGVLREISPKINLIKVLSTHIKPKKMLTKEQAYKFLEKSVESGTDLVYLPNELLSFLQGVNSGDLRFNIELNDSKHQLRNIEQLVHLVMITILDVAYILGTSLIVMRADKKLPFIFYIYLILGGICTAWIFYKLFVNRLKNRRK
jgi:ubiquinone biosynthesis protein